MANIKSQIKRIKQNEKRRLKNSQIKSSIRTASKKVIKAAESKEKPEVLRELYVEFSSTIDKAAGVGIIHKNTAARKKSRIAKRIISAQKSQS